VKNKGIKIGVVFILLFALLSVAGCQQEDVVIVGVEPGQPGPTSGQLRISFAPVSSSASIKLSPNITINDLSLSADMSFTVTNTDTNATTVLTGVVIDADPAFTHAEFDANGSALSTTRVSLLIPYTLEPGNYKVTAVTGSINFLCLSRRKHAKAVISKIGIFRFLTFHLKIAVTQDFFDLSSLQTKIVISK